MNRKSLFGRLAESKSASKSAERQEYFRMHIEPLEDRKMLATTTYYNDDWTDQNGGSLVFGDLVDSTDFGGVSNLTYGIDAFGLSSTGSGALPNIADAIDQTDADGFLLIGAGTHFQSDIVIDSPLTMLGEGQGNTFIYPETASAGTSGDFPAGTHSGIIIHSDRVTISDLTLDGAGNTSLAGSLNYHHGITTLYDTPGGSTVRNGTLVEMQLGPGGQEPNETVPDLDIQRVTVNNVFWHGITISALEDKTFDTGNGSVANLNVWNSTINNVGPSVKTADHIGVLMQNVNDNTVNGISNIGAVNQAEYVAPSNGVFISNVGVGVKTAPFGTIPNVPGPPPDNTGNDNGAGNNADTIGVTVDNASVYGFWFQDMRGDDSVALVATQSGGFVDGAVGIFLDHSRATRMFGTRVEDYDIGLLVRNTKLGDGSATPGSAGTPIAPFAWDLDLIGPGPGSSSAGSVGLLVEGDSTNEAVFRIGANISISGFDVGAEVTNDNANPDFALLSVDRPQLSGNTTDFVVGDKSLLLGPVTATSSISVTGTGVINPRGTTQYNFRNDGVDWWQGNAAFGNTPDAVPDKAATAGATDITLGSGATFTPVLTGEDAAPDERWDFNNSENYIGLLAPPLNTNGSLVAPQAPYGALTVWSGQVTQDGSGALVLGGTATNGAGLGYLYGTDHIVDPNNSSVYLLQPESHVNRTYMNVAIKLDAASEAKFLLFGINDRRGNTESWEIPTSILNTSTYTTVTINLLAPSTALTANDGGPDPSDAGVDLSNIAGYTFGGDNGLANGNQSIPLRFSVDGVTFTDQKASMLEVSGSIDLGGATLSPDLRAGYVPADTEEFTIVNNTSGGAVTGTFAGLGQGSSLSVDGVNFEISYVGGDGNDVVLTKVPGSTGTVVDRLLFYDNSKFDGATAGINPGDSAAVPPSKSAYLPGSGTITADSMSSYSRGINGIFVDIQGAPGTLSLSDFEFAVSNQGAGGSGANNTPSTWAAAPAPTGFTVLADTPVAGTDRVEFIWADNAIDNRYLEVTTLANANTGLAEDDIFYFGHNRGDAFNDASPVVWLTSSTDETAIQAAPIVSLATIDSLFDMDRNGVHLASDRIVARGNTVNALTKINIGSPPPAPAGDGDGAGSAVASALAASGSSDGGEGSAWVDESVAAASAGSAPVAAAVAELADADGPGELGSSDGEGDDLDDLLDALVDDLA